jgi:DNA-binding GntR family transcriptional regulator
MKIHAVDISRTASAASVIYDALKEAIIEGRLADGDPLRQDEIATMFNTSRIPVREAIAKLEQQGLVRSQRYKGAVVAGISPEAAGEIFDFRAMLESHVIAVSVPRMSRETLTEARGYLQDFSDSSDPMEWGRLNRLFHTALYRDSGLSYHLGIIDTTLDRIDRYLRAQLSLSNGVARANNEHIAILEACEAGQAELAAHLTRRHILGAKANLMENLHIR